MVRHGMTSKALDNLPETTDEPQSKGNGPRLLDSDGLTEKQATFARLVANGSTLRAAYEKSYDTSKMQLSAIYVEASKMLDKPKVALKVKTLLEARAKQTHALDAKLIRQHVFDRLMIESLEAKEGNARLRALELLGKIDVVSMFRESKAIDGNTDETPETLKAKLQAMLDKMIDVSPRH